MISSMKFMNSLGGNPLDQGEPGQAGGIPFSFIAIVCILLLIGAGLWFFITDLLPDLFKVRSWNALKVWLKEFWGGLLSVIIFGSILAFIAFVLYKIGL